MLQDYLRAGHPAILLLTQEPHRAESVLPRSGWTILSWDCLRGLRQTGRPQIMDEVRDPVEAMNRLGEMQDTVLLAHNLHLFFDISEVLQAIQNGIPRWKSTGCCPVMASPMEFRPPADTADVGGLDNLKAHCIEPARSPLWRRRQCLWEASPAQSAASPTLLQRAPAGSGRYPHLRPRVQGYWSVSNPEGVSYHSPG